MKIILLSILFFAIPFLAKCQFSESVHIDLGRSTISPDPYLRFASSSQYNWKKFHGVAGFQYTFLNKARKNISGLKIALGRDFEINSLPISADLFFMQNPYSKLIRESNFGIIVQHQRQRLDIDLGYHMRKYSLNKKADETSDLAPGADLSIWEYRNFIYKATLYLKKQNSDWNISASITNYDHFLIQQETNPMINLSGFYRVAESLSIKMEFWYQGAGMLNLSPNHYGYYFRAGLEWGI